jgi:hypothetical protein
MATARRDAARGAPSSAPRFGPRDAVIGLYQRQRRRVRASVRASRRGALGHKPAAPGRIGQPYGALGAPAGDSGPKPPARSGRRRPELTQPERASAETPHIGDSGRCDRVPPLPAGAGRRPDIRKLSHDTDHPHNPRSAGRSRHPASTGRPSIPPASHQARHPRVRPSPRMRYDAGARRGETGSRHLRLRRPRTAPGCASVPNRLTRRRDPRARPRAPAAGGRG